MVATKKSSSMFGPYERWRSDVTTRSPHANAWGANPKVFGAFPQGPRFRGARETLSLDKGGSMGRRGPKPMPKALRLLRHPTTTTRQPGAALGADPPVM